MNWEFGEFQGELVKFDDLRYRLLPYIYSNAWKITHDGCTEEAQRISRPGHVFERSEGGGPPLIKNLLLTILPEGKKRLVLLERVGISQGQGIDAD